MAIDFIQRYFIEPIYSEGMGYNFYNTIVYGLIALGLLYLIFKGLEKMNVKIDFRFFLATIPFVFLGSSMRALVDNKFYPISFWSVSPGIYFLIAGIFIGTFLLAYLIEKKWKFPCWKTCWFAGWIFVVINLGLVRGKFIQFENLGRAMDILLLAIGISFAIYVVAKLFRIGWLSEKVNFMPIAGHMLDASATFVAVDFLGYVEQHPIPRMLSEFTGTAGVMFLLKLAVIIPVIYLINKEIEDENLRNFLFITIAVLGFAEGLRDLLTIIF